MLTDAEEGDVEGWNEYHIVKAYFGPRGNDHLDAANPFYGTLCGSITQSDERGWIHVWAHGIEQMPRVDHVAVGPTVDDKCSSTPGAVTM